jgi:hypothetical protein
MGGLEADAGGFGSQGRQMDKQHTETMQALANQHKEITQALSVLIERTGGRGAGS